MSMDVSTGIKARACMALLLAILCCGCDRSSDSSNDDSTDRTGSDDSENPAEPTEPTEPDEDAAWKNATRVEETSLDTVFSDGWVHANTSQDWSGDTAAFATGEASMSFNFTGTQIRLIGWRESAAGKARVLLDGEEVGEIDQYSNTIDVQAPVFTSEVLEQGPHTLTIEVTGKANRKSTGTMVVVDAFEILSEDEISLPRVTRTEETASAVEYTGDWQHGDSACSCSGGTKSFAGGPDALVSFEFTGTRVRWLGFRKQAAGMARVYLDGALAAEVDLYSETVSSQAPIFTSDVLDDGPHTLLIEATGSGNAEATGTFVTVDAFDVAK